MIKLIEIKWESEWTSRTVKLNLWSFKYCGISGNIIANLWQLFEHFVTMQLLFLSVSWCHISCVYVAILLWPSNNIIVTYRQYSFEQHTILYWTTTINTFSSYDICWHYIWMVIVYLTHFCYAVTAIILHFAYSCIAEIAQS